MTTPRPLAFYEFFAGGGMARAGLGAGWDCAFANDFDPVKADCYAANWGAEHLDRRDVWALKPADLPVCAGGAADLAWASSPCQDLSLAGRRAGLSGARSSAFWGFHKLIMALAAEGRAPRTLVIENVAGLLTSSGGTDFTALVAALDEAGYRVGALEVDARLYTPQSRPRLFVVAAREAHAARLAGPGPALPFHTARVQAAHARLPEALKAKWLWWALPTPPAHNADLSGLLQPDEAVGWHAAARTEAMLALLSPLHRRRVDGLVAAGERRVGAIYRRMRVEAGRKVQRAELRLDGLAGCLRTPGGGSSRQFLLVVDGGGVRTRPLTPLEGARLMGLPEGFDLPARPSLAFKVLGDGVASPVVAGLAQAVLAPLLRAG